MKLWRWTAVGAMCVAAMTASACDQMTEGTPAARSSSSTATAKPSKTMTAAPTANNGAPPVGVVPTTRAPLPAQAVTCSPPARPGILIVAKVADPAAPRVMVPVPGGFSLARGSGDVATRMTGPDGAMATVTIAPTKLDAAEAFRDYVDHLTAKYSVSALSFLPGEMCGYSGQKVTGTLSNTSADTIQFTDRMVHVWTNAGDYLVVIHVEGPGAYTDLDAISETLTGDFEIRIP